MTSTQNRCSQTERGWWKGIFLCLGGSEKITMMRPTDGFQYCLKFQVLTDVSVVHLADWTSCHKDDTTLYSTCSSWSASPRTPDNWISVLSFLLPLKTSLIQTLTWKFFQELLCSVSFKQLQIISHNTVASNGTFTNIAVMCKIRRFHYHKNCKVSNHDILVKLYLLLEVWIIIVPNIIVPNITKTVSDFLKL